MFSDLPIESSHINTCQNNLNITFLKVGTKCFIILNDRQALHKLNQLIMIVNINNVSEQFVKLKLNLTLLLTC